MERHAENSLISKYVRAAHGLQPLPSLKKNKKDAASRWFASDQKCMRLTSTFELSLGSI